MNRLSKTILSAAIAAGTAIQTNAQNMNKVPTVRLSNGMEMPQLGVGTFLVRDDAAERVCHAIKTGFRLIDTAQGYGNEKGVGEGIRLSGVDRSELFITTKVNTTEMRGGTVRQSLDKSLADLGTGYIDLVLIHWPVQGHIKETWQIPALKREKRPRELPVVTIGVSLNYVFYRKHVLPEICLL